MTVVVFTHPTAPALQHAPTHFLSFFSAVFTSGSSWGSVASATDAGVEVASARDSGGCSGISSFWTVVPTCQGTKEPTSPLGWNSPVQSAGAPKGLEAD